MVKLNPFFVFSVALALTFPLHAKDQLDYRVGDKAAEDIVTPVQLTVVDPVATETLKDRESTRVPVVFRHNEHSAILVEDDVRATFAAARSNFVFLMHSSFHHTKLEEDAIASDQFDRLMASFRNRFKTFPLTRELAEQWARGEGGLVAQTTIIVRLREAMSQPIRQDNLTNAPKIGSQVRLVSVAADDQPISIEDAEKRGSNISKTNLLTLSRARIALSNRFAPAEEDYARFALRMLRPNTFVESDLTVQARARHVEPLLAADNYLPGQIIATQGQVIDRKVMAAISQLRERTAVGRLQQQVAQERTQTAQVQEQATLAKVEIAKVQERNRWLLYGFGATVVLLTLVVWRLARRRRPAATLMPATLSANMAVSVESGDANPWQQRALEAEARAERAHEAIRQGVFAQLREKIIGGLVTQRSGMLETQKSAAAEMAALEKRLNELHAPLQERLRTYEQRIADLEKALATKSNENRDLIKATIELMRKQLEAERAKDRLEYN